MNLVTIDTAPGNMSMYIAPNNTSYLEVGKNASTIIIGPVSQTTQTNVSTVINGVRIDSNVRNGNLFISSGNTSYMVTSSDPVSGINTCNTVLSNHAFSVNPMTGDHCTAVGHNCLTKNSTGDWNIAIGSDTLANVTTGSYNTALGGFALSLATDSNQVAVGWNALSKTVTAAYPNVAVGRGALQNYNYSGGGANVAVGDIALGGLTTGTGNVAIGFLADNAPNVGNNAVNTTASNNICIGNQATSNNFTNCIAIGSGAYCNANNQIIIGSASGGQATWIQGSGGFNVNGGPTALGATTASTLSAGGCNLFGGGYQCRAGTGGSYSNVFNWYWNDAVLMAYVDNVHVGTLCDYRIKENIKPTAPVLDKLCSINMFDFTHKKISIFKPSGNHIGFFAHQLKETFIEYPKLVTFEKDDLNEDGTFKFQLIEMPILNLIIMKAVQEQNAIVKNVIKENDDLKSRLSAIEARLAAAGI